MSPSFSRRSTLWRLWDTSSDSSERYPFVSNVSISRYCSSECVWDLRLLTYGGTSEISIPRATPTTPAVMRLAVTSSLFPAPDQTRPP
eukprot:scaffold43752_cov51-Attheya_sp.AAC.3